jgi:hypothetical protein
MVELDFAIEQASVAKHSASPMLLFALAVTNKTCATRVENVQLRVQIRIEPTQRRYDAPEQDRLIELFGAPARWGETLRSLLWTHVNASVPAFAGTCRIELPAPCSYDFNLAATKYFHGLGDGEAPLSFLFSGSIFYRDEDDRLQIEQVAWSKEATYRLPARLWHDLMRDYYADGLWLRLGHDMFERLYRFKRSRGLPSWDQAFAELLAAQDAGGTAERSP